MRYVLVGIMCVLISGCSVSEAQKNVDQAKEVAPDVGAKAEQVFTVMEQVLGRELVSQALAEKGLDVTSDVGKYGEKVQAVLSFVKRFAPEKYQESLDLGHGVLGLIVVLSQLAIGFFAKRAKTNGKIVQAAVTSVDGDVQAVGSLTDAAKKLGVADALQDNYEYLKKTGVVGSK